MTTVEEEDHVHFDESGISMQPGPECDGDTAAMESLAYQKEALKQCYSDYLYWRSNHGAVHYGIRRRRTKAWRLLAQRIMQSVTENV